MAASGALTTEPGSVSAPVERDVTASGVRLRVVEHGTGQTVVFVHSLFMDHRTWDGVRAAMQGEFRIITPDLPGFGQSEKPAPSRFPYGINAFSEAIADLYAGLEIGRAALVGHGLGGAIALTLAARHPELLSHLVLVDPWVYPGRMGLELRLAHLPLISNLIFKQLVGRGWFRTYFRNRLISPSASVDVQRIDSFYEVFNSPAARGSALATLSGCADTRSVEAQTTRIRTPTLVIWGSQDELTSCRHGQRLAREIRGAGLELIDTGHSPQEERPTELAGLIRRFLRSPIPTFG
ncbi:MAG TPA: alpha/beta hydrolase [Polyangiaceae bacterium]|nr:alpha/beta hydrolase [Polyangiaceae bacterium]